MSKGVRVHDIHILQALPVRKIDCLLQHNTFCEFCECCMQIQIPRPCVSPKEAYIEGIKSA